MSTDYEGAPSLPEGEHDPRGRTGLVPEEDAPADRTRPPQRRQRRDHTAARAEQEDQRGPPMDINMPELRGAADELGIDLDNLLPAIEDAILGAYSKVPGAIRGASSPGSRRPRP